MGYTVCVCMYMHTLLLSIITYQLYQLYYVRFLICICNPANKCQYSLWYLIFNTLSVTVTLHVIMVAPVEVHKC